MYQLLDLDEALAISINVGWQQEVHPILYGPLNRKAYFYIFLDHWIFTLTPNVWTPISFRERQAIRKRHDP